MAMLKVNFKNQDALTQKSDVLIVFAYGEKWLSGALAKKVDQAVGGALFKLAKARDFKAKAGETLELTPITDTPFGVLKVVGVGKEAPKQSADLIKAVGEQIRPLRTIKGVSKVSVLLPFSGEDECLNAERTVYVGAIAAHLGGYLFSKKSEDPPKVYLKEVNLFLPDEAPKVQAKKVVDRAAAVASGVNLARDLVNEPADTCTPDYLAKTAKELAKEYGLKVSVWDEKKIIQEKMNLYYAVAKGSSVPPRFIKIEYAPKGTSRKKPIVLVGKGLTFDAGGLGIKPWDGMLTMKMDMAGSAAVIGTMKAIAQLKPNRRVIALVAACENMPGAAAYKPGDIITGRGGISVEIHHTDAEGRLTLADALSYGVEQKPEFIIDLATLTGACIVALGEYTVGVMGNDEKLTEQILSCAKTAGEDMWQLPLNPKLKEKLKSPDADLRNIGGRWGGAITAGLFLQAFVKDTPWVHLDIAGPAFAESDFGPYSHGGTGVGVLTLVELLNEF